MKPNIAILEELAALLEGNHPKFKMPQHYLFDMRHYWAPPDEMEEIIELKSKENPEIHKCGTSGCALGYAVQYLPSFQEHYLLNYDNISVRGVPKNVFSSMGSPIGLTNAEFWYLFSAHGDTVAEDAIFQKLPPEHRFLGRAVEGQEALRDVVSRIRCLALELRLREQDEIQAVT